MCGAGGRQLLLGIMQRRGGFELRRHCHASGTHSLAACGAAFPGTAWLAHLAASGRHAHVVVHFLDAGRQVLHVPGVVLDLRDGDALGGVCGRGGRQGVTPRANARALMPGDFPGGFSAAEPASSEREQAGAAARRCGGPGPATRIRDMRSRHSGLSFMCGGQSYSTRNIRCSKGRRAAGPDQEMRQHRVAVLSRTSNVRSFPGWRPVLL